MTNDPLSAAVAGNCTQARPVMKEAAVQGRASEHRERLAKTARVAAPANQAGRRWNTEAGQSDEVVPRGQRGTASERCRDKDLTRGALIVPAMGGDPVAGTEQAGLGGKQAIRAGAPSG